MKITIPDIGDFDAVEVIEVLVSEGDTLDAEQAMIVLESDKATMEVPSPAAGRLSQLTVAVGDKVAQGDVIGELEVSASSAQQPEQEKEQSASQKPAEPAAESEAESESREAAAQTVAEETDKDAARPTQPTTAAPAGGEIPHASPSVRQFARELGVELAQVHGSGPKGRILKQDVQQHVKQAMQGGAAPASGGVLPQMPKIDFEKFGEVEVKPLSRIRKLSAANLHRNWLVVPHVTQFERADITELEAFRKSENARGEVKLTLLPFVIKAAAMALRRYPDFNSSLSPEGDSLIVKKYCHIGFAADTPQGLVVPVIRDVASKSVTQLASEAAAMAAKARDGKLSPADMQGGCFSISSLGGIGGSHFTPIVNAPEVAILGVSRASIEPVWDGAQFQPRTLLTLSLSYDHRVIDGAAAARMAVYLSELLSDIRRLCL